MPHAKKHGRVTLHPVKSSNVHSAGHDPERDQMHVAYHSGIEGHYDNVDANTFRMFLAAPSQGTFIHKFIKSKPKLYVWHPHEKSASG